MSERKKILVVDDDPSITFFCRTVLETRDYQVFTASSGREGLALAASVDPDLVVLDIMMEEVDSGFQVAMELAATRPGMPIVMLSSIAGASSQVFDTTKLPVARLVDKPIEAEELLSSVDLLLARS